MARPWKNGDSARTMTQKYNETATEVESLKSKIGEGTTSGGTTSGGTTSNSEQLQEVQGQLDRFQGQLDGFQGQLEGFQGQLEGFQGQLENVANVTAEDIGLGNVDNTSDIDKPVSTAQQQAIDSTVQNMITSELATEFSI